MFDITLMIELEYAKGEVSGSIHAPDVLTVRDGGNVTTCELLEGVFPDYRRVIPSSNGDNGTVKAIGVNPEYISNAVKALKVITNKTASMNIEFNGENGLIKVRPSSFHSASQMTDVMIGIMPVRV